MSWSLIDATPLYIKIFYKSSMNFAGYATYLAFEIDLGVWMCIALCDIPFQNKLELLSN